MYIQHDSSTLLHNAASNVEELRGAPLHKQHNQSVLWCDVAPHLRLQPLDGSFRDNVRSVRAAVQKNNPYAWYAMLIDVPGRRAMYLLQTQTFNVRWTFLIRPAFLTEGMVLSEPRKEEGLPDLLEFDAVPLQP